jgi:hypothetical protein
MNRMMIVCFFCHCHHSNHPVMVTINNSHLHSLLFFQDVNINSWYRSKTASFGLDGQCWARNENKNLKSNFLSWFSLKCSVNFAGMDSDELIFTHFEWLCDFDKKRML